MILFETERLIIRKGDLTDFEDFLTIRNSAPFLKYNPMPPVTKDEGLDEFKQLIKEGTMNVISLKEGAMIGMIDSYPDALRYNVNSEMISYNMNEQYVGKGYMQEALRGMIDHLFRREGKAVISARVFKGNDISKHLLEKAGFTHEGTLRHCVKGNGDIIHDDWIFSLMKEEYNQ